MNADSLPRSPIRSTRWVRGAGVLILVGLVLLAGVVIGRVVAGTEDDSWPDTAIDSLAVEEGMLPPDDVEAGGQPMGRDLAQPAPGGTADLAGTDATVVLRAAQWVTVADVSEATARTLAQIDASGGRVEQQVTSAAGGCVGLPVDSTVDSSMPVPCSEGASTTLTVRVPPESADDLLASVAGLGEQEWLTRSSTDVATQIADVDARLQTARAGIDRLRTLLAQAERLADIIALESELTSRQSEVESLQARQRVLADQVAMASLTITLSEAPAGEQPAGGFLDGIQRGWEALLAIGSAALLFLGMSLPFLIPVVLVAAAVIAWRRRRTPRTPTAATADRLPADQHASTGEDAPPSPQDPTPAGEQ